MASVRMELLNIRCDWSSEYRLATIRCRGGKPSCSRRQIDHCDVRHRSPAARLVRLARGRFSVLQMFAQMLFELRFVGFNECIAQNAEDRADRAGLRLIGAAAEFDARRKLVRALVLQHVIGRSEEHTS